MIKNFYSEVIDGACSDDISKLKFNNIYQHIKDDVYQLNLVCLVLIVVLFCFDSFFLFIFAIKHFMAKRRMLKEEEYHYNDF